MDPFDDLSIAGEDLVIRRVDPNQHLATDRTNGCKRLSTKLFSASSGDNEGMSVDIPSLMEQAGVSPCQYVTNPKHVGSVVFTAGSARSALLMVGHQPVPDNPYHGQVWARSETGRFSKGQQRALLAAATWFVPISGVEITS